MAKKIFMVTTETSGDLLAGRMVTELRNMIPDLELAGVGGELLMAEGMEILYQVRDFNLMGLVEVLSQLPRLKKAFKHLVAEVESRRPDLIILVDAPDFNLRFAKAVRGLGIPIVYFVSPQVWAWRPGRARSIAKMVDHMLVLFAFEVDFYRDLGLDTTWVGHPLVDELKDMGGRATFFEQHEFDPKKPLVALAPGSRASEVNRLLPTMVEIAMERKKEYQFGLPLAGTIDKQRVSELLGDAPVTILPGQMRNLMAHADAAVVASGTATLETALLGTPMVVGYRLKQLTYLMARFLVKVPHISLVNIVLNQRIVPEMIQSDFTKDKILPLLDELLTQGHPARARQLEAFARLEDLLGGGGASKRAATVIKGYLKP